MAKKFIKSKSTPNATGPGFRTSDHFKGSIFSGGGSKFSGNRQQPKNVKAFNPGQFKTQHKG
jgi:hypothetical protein